MSSWTLLPFPIYTCCFLNEHLLIGLTGSSQSEYVKTFVTVAKEEVNFSCGWVKILEYFQVGARCCVFNYRGRGGVSLASPRTYCASDPSDLGEVSGNKMYVWECREFEDVKLQNKNGDIKSTPSTYPTTCSSKLFSGSWTPFLLKIWSTCPCGKVLFYNPYWWWWWLWWFQWLWCLYYGSGWSINILGWNHHRPLWWLCWW